MALYEHWTDVTEITASRATCRCGWRGEIRESRDLAITDAREHKDAAGVRPAAAGAASAPGCDHVYSGVPPVCRQCGASPAGEAQGAEPAPGARIGHFGIPECARCGSGCCEVVYPHGHLCPEAR